MLYHHRKIAFISLESTFDTFTAACDSQSSTSDIPNTSKIKFQHVKFLLIDSMCLQGVHNVPPRPPYLFFKNKRASDNIYMTIGGDFENRGLSGKGEGVSQKS